MTIKASAAAGAHYGEIARIGKALGSPVRLTLLDLLRRGRRSVEELADAAGVSVANSSQHLQHMRAAGLVVGERRGQRVEYRLATEAVSTAFAALRELAAIVRRGRAAGHPGVVLRRAGRRPGGGPRAGPRSTQSTRRAPAAAPLEEEQR